MINFTFIFCKIINKIYFIFMYVGINVVALIFANYQSYIARKYPSAYNEGYCGKSSRPSRSDSPIQEAVWLWQ